MCSHSGEITDQLRARADAYTRFYERVQEYCHMTQADITSVMRLPRPWGRFREMLDQWVNEAANLGVEEDQ